MNAYKAQGQPLCITSKFYKKPRRLVNDPHYTEDEMEAERPCPGSQSLTSPSCTFLVCKVGIILPTFRGGWGKVPAVLGTLPLASGYSLHPPHQPQPPHLRTQNQLGDIFPSERRLVAGLGRLDLRVQKQPGTRQRSREKQQEALILAGCGSRSPSGLLRIQSHLWGAMECC